MRRVPGGRRGWSPARLNAALCTGGWAALLWWLMVSGRTSLYLSSRTGWVVPMGAVLLTLATGGSLLTARAHVTAPVTRRAAVATALILVPAVGMLALPPASLGSFAAARRSTLSSAGTQTSGRGDISGDITLFEIAAAARSRAAMQALVDRAGAEVSLVGFVDREEGMPADEFRLTRFLVTCCAADALSVQVRVVGAPPGAVKRDEWVRVIGDIYPLGGEVLVDATEVEEVERPARPYLSS